MPHFSLFGIQDSFRHLLKGKDNRNLKLQIARHRGNVGLRLRYQEAENPTLDDVEIGVRTKEELTCQEEKSDVEFLNDPRRREG